MDKEEEEENEDEEEEKERREEEKEEISPPLNPTLGSAIGTMWLVPSTIAGSSSSTCTTIQLLHKTQSKSISKLTKYVSISIGNFAGSLSRR